MYTPNPTVTKVFEAMKFRHLDNRLRMIPHFPWPGLAVRPYRVLHDVPDILAVLSPESAKKLRDHQHLPWLRHVAIGNNSDYCHIMYKISRWKRLRVANALYISDVANYLRYRKSLGSHLLLRHGIAITKVDARFLPAIPSPSFLIDGGIPKLYRSETLAGEDMSYLYSEIVGLDL